MTQIEVSDGDIAEALGSVPSWGNGPQAIAAVKADDWRWFDHDKENGRDFLVQIKAHAHTIAQLRVAREALEEFIRITNSECQVSSGRELCTWMDRREKFEETLAQITQETPNAG